MNGPGRNYKANYQCINFYQFPREVGIFETPWIFSPVFWARQTKRFAITDLNMCHTHCAALL
jgi:hypothetical protein